MEQRKGVASIDTHEHGGNEAKLPRFIEFRVIYANSFVMNESWKWLKLDSTKDCVANFFLELIL